MSRLKNLTNSDDEVVKQLALARDMLDARRVPEMFVARHVEKAYEAVQDERAAHSIELTEQSQRLSDEARRRVEELVSSHDTLAQKNRELAERVETLTPQAIRTGDEVTVQAPGKKYYEQQWTVETLMEALINFQVAGAAKNCPIDVHHTRVTCDVRYPLPPTAAQREGLERARAREKREARVDLAQKIGFGVLAACVTPPLLFVIISALTLAWTSAWSLL